MSKKKKKNKKRPLISASEMFDSTNNQANSKLSAEEIEIVLLRTVELLQEGYVIDYDGGQVRAVPDGNPPEEAAACCLV